MVRPSKLAPIVLLAGLAGAASSAYAQTDAYRGEPVYEQSLVFYHAPKCVRFTEIVETLNRVAGSKSLPLRIIDIGKDENFRKFIEVVNEREIEHASSAVLVAGAHIKLGYHEILPFLDELAAGKVALDKAPPPTLESLEVQKSAGGKFRTEIVQEASETGSPAPVAPADEAAPPRPLFPIYGSWTAVAAILAAGIFLGMIGAGWSASRRQRVKAGAAR